MGLDTNRKFELFRKYYRDNKGAVDIGHSDSSSETSKQLEGTLENVFANMDKNTLASQYNVTVPPDLKALGAHVMFNDIKGLENIKAENVTIWPQTSVVLKNFAVEIFKEKKIEDALKHNIDYPYSQKFVLLESEGNFRYGNGVEKSAHVERRFVPVDKKGNFKITPESLENTIQKCCQEGNIIVAFSIDTPSNPWMKVYSNDELKALDVVIQKHGIPVINDLYLAGTESPMKDQGSYAAATGNKNNVITTIGVRRKFGLDKVGKIGFLASHNEELVDKVNDLVMAHHQRYTNADYQTIVSLLPVNSHDAEMQLRTKLAENRIVAEGMINSISGLKIITKADAGPFVIAGFDDELIDKMTKLGIKGDFRAAEYFAETGNVSLMPLSSMSTDMEGFRINVCDLNELQKGLNGMQKAINSINEGVSYEDISFNVKRAYDEAMKSQNPYYKKSNFENFR